jgi:hypothetical protein
MAKLISFDISEEGRSLPSVSPLCNCSKAKPAIKYQLKILHTGQVHSKLIYNVTIRSGTNGERTESRIKNVRLFLQQEQHSTTINIEIKIKI